MFTPPSDVGSGSVSLPSKTCHKVSCNPFAVENHKTKLENASSVCRALCQLHRNDVLMRFAVSRRAQSVRRTSLRDKGLTTKKDAVEEARFRLQAQEVSFVAVNLDVSSTLTHTQKPAGTHRA